MSIDGRGLYTGSAKSKNERPPALWKSSTADINLSWHHVIPHAILQDCWQTLAHGKQLDKCKVALESFMRLLKVDSPRQWLRAMESNALSFDQQMELDTRISWPAWNIIEGPARRRDDPNDGLDEFTFGLTAPEFERQKKLKKLFLAVQGFNDATAAGAINEETAAAVAVAMNNVERTLVAGDVIRFRIMMWKETSPPPNQPLAMQGVRWWKKRPGVGLYQRWAV
jgi:hypothetical protein